ncbi:MAG: PPOX class F420-dependent oxidoreductase [Anaerolineaceae bacterium]
MGSSIPTGFIDLFKKRAFGHLATIMPDGSPQVSPLWVDFDGTCIILNSEVGRQKDLNMRRDDRIALEIQDPDDPYRFLLIRGKVVEITLLGADGSIDQLAIKYTGEKYKYKNPDHPRVIYKVQPIHVKTSQR